jgi:hypothetical protein
MSEYDDDLDTLDRAAGLSDIDRINQDNAYAKTLKRDAKARQRGENIDGSVRRETVSDKDKAYNKLARELADKYDREFIEELDR